MGRFGHRLFDHDQALNSATVLCQEIAQDSKADLAHLIVETIRHAPHGVASYYLKDYDLPANLPSEDENVKRRVQQKLDNGLGDELFKKYRDKFASLTEEHMAIDGDRVKVSVILLAAMMMRYGATIKDDDLKYVRELFSTIASSEIFQMPISDLGFRGPGKRQFQAALDNYQPGIYRDFSQPSCHACGKCDVDIVGQGKALMKCGGCENPISAAYFCDKDCQKSLWKSHKQGNCGHPRGPGTAVWHAQSKQDKRLLLFAYGGATV